MKVGKIEVDRAQFSLLYKLTRRSSMKKQYINVGWKPLRYSTMESTEGTVQS